MSDIAFIVANKRSNQGYESTVKAYTDCTMSITHSFKNSVTRLTTEEDADSSDHIQRQSNEFEVAGIFSSTSFSSYTGDSVDKSDRIKAAYRFLKGLRDNKSVFTLITNLDVYESCTIESLQIPVTPETSASLYFNMSLVQFRKVSVGTTVYVQLPNVTTSKQDDAASTRNSGTKKTASKYTSTSVLAKSVDQIADAAEASAAQDKEIAKLDQETKNAMKAGIGGKG